MRYDSLKFTIDVINTAIDSLINIESLGGAIYINDITYAVKIVSSSFFRCSSTESSNTTYELNVNGGTIFAFALSLQIQYVLIAFSSGVDRGQSLVLICPQDSLIDLNCSCDVGCQTLSGKANGICVLLSTARLSVHNANISDNTNYDPSGVAHFGNYPLSVSISFLAVSNTCAGFSFSLREGGQSSVSFLLFSQIKDAPMIFGCWVDVTVREMHVKMCSGNLFLAVGSPLPKLTLFDSSIGSLTVDESVIMGSNVTTTELDVLPKVCALMTTRIQSFERGPTYFCLYAMSSMDAGQSFDSIRRQSSASRQSQKNFLQSLSRPAGPIAPFPRINSSPIKKPSMTPSVASIFIENNSFICSFSIKSSVLKKSNLDSTNFINIQHSKSIIGEPLLEISKPTDLQIKCLNSNNLSDLKLSQLPGFLDLPIKLTANIKLKLILHLKNKVYNFCQKNNLQKSTFVITLINIDKSVLQCYLTEETISNYFWTILFISAKANEDNNSGSLLFKKIVSHSGMSSEKLKEIEIEVYSRLSCLVLPSEEEFKKYNQIASRYS